MFKGACVMVAMATQLLWIHPVWAESLKFDITAFTVEGNTLLSERKIQNALAAFKGSGREMADVNRAADALRALYQQAGYNVVQVVAPVQTMTAGRVLLKVIEDKIATIEVGGNAAYSAENIRASLPVLQAGKSINANRLEAEIALANENSAKQVAVNIQPGAQLGELNTRIDVSESRVTKFMATLDNTGSAATGYAKLGFAYQHANLWDRDHALTVQYNGSPELPDKIGSISVGYHIPYYQYGWSLDLLAAYSSSSTQNGTSYFAGKGTVLGARANYALTSVRDLRHKVIVGVDYKESKNNFAGCVAPCASVTEQPLSLTYYAQITRPEFQGNGSLSLVSNLTGGSQNSFVNYQAARATVVGSNLVATPIWNAWRVNLGGGVSLPNDWQVRVMGNGQYSQDLLIPAEQFGVGGALSVRGYPERAVSGDKGYTTNLELYTPDLNKYLPIPNDSLRALLFWDTARVTVNDQYPANFAAPPHMLSSIGLGLRVLHKKDVNIKFDLGWAQKQVLYLGSLTRKNDVRGHIAISLVF
ncbi:MAG: ShlB/FhaC/HecB family hemolysin secretion/activation protein [Gallionella sp.]